MFLETTLNVRGICPLPFKNYTEHRRHLAEFVSIIKFKIDMNNVGRKRRDVPACKIAGVSRPAIFFREERILAYRMRLNL